MLREVGLLILVSLRLATPPVPLKDLPESVAYVYDSQTSSHFYLVGTQHYSEVSASDVRHVISAVRPGTVMLELCAGRYVNLFAPSHSASPHEDTDTSNVGGLAGALTRAHRLTDRVGISAGLDFSAALEEAGAMKARVVLGDVDASVTVERIARTSDSRSLLPALFSPKLFIQGGAEIARALLPASEGRLNLVTVMSQPRRFMELLPLVVASSSIFATVAATAWKAEQLAGMTGEVQSNADDLLFAIALAMMLLVLPRLFSVVVSSRDDHLLGSLLECAALSSRDLSSRPPRPAQSTAQHATRGGDANVVVGVMGMLHVNGVVRLFESGVRPSGMPRSVWLSPNQQRFEPPPGFKWEDPESSDFHVLPFDGTPLLASHWGAGAESERER